MTHYKELKSFMSLMRMKTWIVLLILLTVVTGCGSPASSQPILPPVQASEDVLNAEAVVEPERWVVLRAAGSATIAEVLVVEGDMVRAGDLLLTLDPTAAELRIQQAEARLTMAQAHLAQAREGVRRERIAVLEAETTAASAVVTQAMALRDVHLSGATEAELSALHADLVATDVAHQQAVDDHRETMRCYDVRLPGGGEEEVCPALGTYEEMARAREEAAYATLLAAQARIEAVEGSARAKIAEAQAGVVSAQARRDAVQAQLELARSGSTAEAIAAAEANVERAQAALERAQAARNDCQIQAPFDGWVTDLPRRPGEAVAPGQPVATLAALNQLQMRTTDLTELDVARVARGQPAVVTIDAAPEQPLRGRVVRIDQQGQEYLGDVTYPVFIALVEPVPTWLRWGMTAEVTLGEGSAFTSTIQGQDMPPGEPVIAEAVVEPEEWGELMFTVPGDVADLLVSPGDQVDEGDRLIMLDTTQAVLAVQEATAALRAAEAELALRRVQPRPEDISAAAAAVTAAEGELAQAVAVQRRLMAGGAEAEVATVEAQLDALEAQLVQMTAQLRWVEDDGDAKRAERMREDIAVIEREIVAHQDRRAALPRAAAAELRAAQAGVAAAAARRDVAQAELALVKAGSAPWEIALAEAQVDQAKAALAEAELVLEQATLRAPFDGVVTQVRVEMGDQVAPGQAVVVMGSLDRLQVETTDLIELDVPRVVEGQPVQVRVDGMRDRRFSGQVVQIGLRGEPYRGDVTYPVVIRLDEETDLLWGMTTVVEIQAR